jgi:EmrB/QacA subfamily drug resistance transporter
MTLMTGPRSMSGLMNSPPTTTDRLDRSILIVASVVVLGTLMSILDTTIVNVALATLSRELDSPLHTIQWVATGYLVALAVVIPMTGWASERFGAKRLWLVVVGLFVAGSALSGLAWSASSLIFFRILQGLGGGMIMPAGMTILVEAAGPQRVGRVMSVVGAPALLGPVLGPVLGGLILQGLSWRWIFYVNVPIGLVALVLGTRLLPRSEPRVCERLDLRGLALLSPGLAAIVFGLSETSSHGGIAYAGAWAPILAGVGLVAAFTRHALRMGERRPLLDLTLLRAPGFAAAAVATMFIAAVIFGALLVLPLYFQVARGASTLDTGLLLAPQGVGAALAMPISGRLADRIGGGVVAVFGLIVILAATIGLTRLTATTPYAETSAILVLRGIGQGFSMMPMLAAAYATVSRASVPQATTLVNVFQRVGGSLGTALMAVVLESEIKAGLPDTPGVGGGSVQPLSEATRERVAAPLAEAFSHTLWLAVALAAVALGAAVVVALTARRPARSAERAPLVPQQPGVRRARPAR